MLLGKNKTCTSPSMTDLCTHSRIHKTAVGSPVHWWAWDALNSWEEFNITAPLALLRGCYDLKLIAKGFFNSILATSLLHPQLGSLPWSLAAGSEELFSEMCWLGQCNPNRHASGAEQWVNTGMCGDSTGEAGSQRGRTTQAGLAELWARSGNWMMCMNGGIRIAHPNHTASSSSFPEPNCFFVFSFFSHPCWAQDFHCTYNSLVWALKGITNVTDSIQKTNGHQHTWWQKKNIN